ncbi:MAG: PKD domain-containing protein, partial [Sphingobacteriales bacterium]
MRTIAFIIFFFIQAVCPAQNFTNKGTEFWVGYGHNELFSAATPNQQNMVLYLSTELAANVTVSVNGTAWTRTYAIPANSAIPTDLIPKTGADDCRITAEGLFARGIHIVSDVPITAYAHTYGQYSSGATMLLPVETYSYTFYSVNAEQNAGNSYSWFYVVASENNTTVRITPSRPTAGGRAQGVPFTVNLNKGELYNVMGYINGNSSYDLSGSRIQSLPGADGICHPVAVFSGSSRTYICSGSDPFNSGSDYIMQQVFPLNAWGVKYITAPTSKSTAPSAFNPNKYRVYVRDANTLVRRNGVLLSGLLNNSFYDFVSTTPGDVITATKPILMAQFIPSANGCGSTGLGDPEMFIISPVEQAIKNIVFYNSDKQAIAVNYLTMVIPTNGLASLLIDGSNSWEHSYPHPNAPGYTVVVKQLPVTPMQHRVSSDSAFTSVTYGLGDFVSYGYNAGTNLRNLESNVQVKNIYGTGLTAYACAGTPFHPVFKTTYKPSSILWKLSETAMLSPNADVLQTNPVPTDSVTEFQRKFYLYQLPGNYTFSNIGIDTIPVVLTDLLIENCSYSTSLKIPVNVVAGPDVDFTAAPTACEDKTVVFTGVSAATIFPTKWLWTFGDGNIDSVQTVPKTYTTAGSYNVNLTAVRTDGCINSRQKPIEILPASFTAISQVICEGQSYNGHTVSGIYSDTLTAFNSCDSIINLNLTVKPRSFSTVTQSICAGQSYEGYSTAGIYTDVFVAANGCDSVRTLNLTVNAIATTSISQSICQGQSYLGYTAAGIYTDTFTGANGCDSVRTLNLAVNAIATTSISQSICQGQSYLGYSTTGIYADTFTGANGCDSIRTLNLTVNAQSSSSIVQKICEGQSFEGYTTAGTYT